MILRDAYYFAKPAIPLRLRLAIRRALARHLRKKHVGTWPIDEAAGKTPVDWAGWPDGKRFAFVLTHDVEGTKGLNHCADLADMEMRLGFRSAFSFVPEGEYRVPDVLREFLTSNGFEVGVHDLHHDGSLYRSQKAFKAGAEKINRYIQDWGVVGFRSGFMRHNLAWLDEVNILYDSSTFDTDPFEPQPDGVQTIFPFWVSQDGWHGYVELPYTMPQDSTLFLTLQEQSIEIWKRKIDWVAQKGGVALVNTHPDYISFNGRAGLGEYSSRLYRDLLEYVTGRYVDQCWFALPRQVAEYFYATMVAGSGVNRRFVEREGAISSGHRPSGVSSASTDCPTADRWESPSPGMSCLQGKRMAVVSFSNFPGDPRPRRAAETFAQAGMNVEVICLMEEGTPRRDTFKGIEIDRIHIKKVRNSKFWYLIQYGLFIAIAFVKLTVRSLTRRYDVVHIHNMPDVLVFAALVPKLLGSKVILDLHDPMPELMRTIFGFADDSFTVTWMARLEKWSIAFSDRVITVNRACEKIFAGRSCRAEKIQVVMNSPDERIFTYVQAQIREKPSGGIATPFVIMYHGTLVERNGVDLAVEALEKVRRSIPTAELRIYGPRTPFLDEVLRSVSGGDLEKAVQYLGPRKLEQLVEAIEECDVGVIPNKRSIFTEINTPTRIFEYLALGKPVVAPRAPGIQDYFSEEALVFFDLGDAEDLATKLASVATHPYEALETTKRGQAIYQGHAWSREREKLLDLGVGLVRDDAKGK